MLSKKLFTVLCSMLALASSAPAMAIPYSGNTVYKVNVDGQSQIILSGTANSRVAIQIADQERTSARIAGACGEVRVTSTTGDYTGLKVDDMSIDASTLPSQTLPSCANGTFAEARTANFKTPTGQVIVIGKTPGAAVKVMLPVDATRYVTLNACGFGVLRGTSSGPLPAGFKIGTTDYTTASLTTAPGGPPICRTSNNISVEYVPGAWLP